MGAWARQERVRRRRRAREVAEGTLGGEFEKSDRAEVQSKVKDAEEAARHSVGCDACQLIGGVWVRSE